MRGTASSNSASDALESRRAAVGARPPSTWTYLVSDQFSGRLVRLGHEREVLTNPLLRHLVRRLRLGTAVEDADRRDLAVGTLVLHHLVGDEPGRLLQDGAQARVRFACCLVAILSAEALIRADQGKHILLPSSCHRAFGHVITLLRGLPCTPRGMCGLECFKLRRHVTVGRAA